MNRIETISQVPADQAFLVSDGDLKILSQEDLESKEVKFHKCYLEMSKTWGMNSHCKRKKVGCLVVKNNSIIADGYNGTPSGFCNDCEDEEGNTKSYVLHAEANAITKLAKSTQSSEDSVLYVSLSPCLECSKLIIQSDIKKVVFTELYRDLSPLLFLEKGGVDYYYLPNED